VVNAGDPDREGQLLVDELLEHLGNTKPVKRIWLASLDETSVKKAISTMKDNSEYQNLKNSALARSRGDWLVGMNLTRAYTLAGQNSGYSGVLSIGRVQTPTLSLVVKRDLEIENFKPKDFFAITAEIN
jgi:DNA topoisomerase-3